MYCSEQEGLLLEVVEWRRVTQCVVEPQRKTERNPQSLELHDGESEANQAGENDDT